MKDQLMTMYFKDRTDLRKTIMDPFNLKRVGWNDRMRLYREVAGERGRDYDVTASRLRRRLRFEVLEHNKCIVSVSYQLTFEQYDSKNDINALLQELDAIRSFRKHMLADGEYY